MSPSAPHRPPVFTRAFGALIVGTFLQGSAFYFLLPILPLYVAGPIGGDETMVGLVVGCFSITAVLVRPIGGWLLDRYGRRIGILLAATGFCACMFGYLAATGLVLLVILRLVHGVSWGLSGIATATAAADLVPEERRGEGMGYYGLAMPLALVTGPMIGSTLLDRGDFDGLFLGAGIAALASLAAFVLVKTPPVRDPESRLAWNRVFEPRVARLFWMWLLPCAGYGALVAFTPLYAEKVGFESAGPLFSLYALGALASRPLAGRWYDRSGPRPVLLAGFSLLLIGWLVVSFWVSRPGLILGAVLLGMGIGVALPAFQTMVIDLVEPERRGAANATTFSAYDIGVALGAMGAGLLAERVGLQAVFLTAAGLVALAMGVFAFWVYPHYRANRL